MNYVYTYIYIYISLMAMIEEITLVYSDAWQFIVIYNK
jgi:hypothetical protein